MGFLALYGNWRNWGNRMFFLATFGALGWMLSLYWGYFFADNSNAFWALVLIRLAYSFSVLGMSSMSLFFYFFPRRTISISKPFQVSFLLYTLILTVVAATPWIHESLIFDKGVYVSDRLGPLYFLYVLDILINLILAFYLGINKLIHARGIEKEKILFATSGYFLFVTLAVLTNVLLPIFGIFLMQNEIPILNLFFVVPAFYALQKYRFLNIPNASLNLLKKILVISFFSVITILCICLGYYFFPSASILTVGLASSLVAYLATNQLRSLLPDFITETFRQFRDALNEFKAKIGHCDTYGKLQRLVDETFLVKLNFVTAKIYVVRETKSKLILPVYLQDPFTKELYSYPKDILVKEEIHYKKISEEKKEVMVSALNEMGADLCVPLFSGKALIGFFVVRKREGRAFFSKEEIDELSKVKEPLEIGLMNILLTMNLVEENDVMRDVIHKKTQELRERLQKIKTLSEQQSDFIAVTAHELRTPLSIAVFQVKELLSRTPENDYQEMMRGLREVDETLGNLTSLTQKLFDTQQFDFNKVKLHTVKTDIEKYVKGIYDECKSIMNGKAVDFVLQDQLSKPLRISIDPAQIRQVFHNLIGNAYKFVPAGGLIEFECKEAKGGVVISVSDTGRGIPNALKPSVFDKFRSKGPKSGIGLGLYISKKIIELHGGKIWVEDSPLGGALFSVFLKK
jgi:signal transduction histidine kinase